MNFNDAVRLTEFLLGFAFAQQSIEFIKSIAEMRNLFLLRLLLSLLLISGYQTTWVSVFLLFLSIRLLYYFQGPYNGGSDRMGILIIFCLCMVHLAPTKYWQELAFAYLALQLVLSYFISGWVKIFNPEWRNGQALRDVFLFSAYPVSESLRQWSNSPRVLFYMSWGVMLFEMMFPPLILSINTLAVALIVAACFHLSNAFLFGLNRFFWVWISAYPSLLWMQQSLLASILSEPF